MSPLAPSAPPQTPRAQGRRQAMTAREISAFDEMFEMIFDATGTSKPGSSTSQTNVGVGRGDISDLLGKLRTHSKKMRWTSEADEALDLKKEEMDMCGTDYQLLEWAMREIFQESIKYEEAARQAISAAAESQTPVDLPPLQPPAYPHLLAHLMHTFRDKYHDPNLALAMFDHARNLSIASYVFGCSTQAYNELIETRWTCFYDIQGVHDALQEMTINGVDVDSRTRRLVEMVRREAAQRDLWFEESQLGSGEVMRLLTKIDELAAKPLSRSRKASTLKSALSKNPAKWGDWKATPLEDKPDDQWAFDQWDRPSRRDQGFREGSQRRTFERVRTGDKRRFGAFKL
ncbi:hypothetical protein BDZ94DRAFT_1185769 [Collybia nuda]|uniref:Mtf2-like C-terminal domain-containing protein n=1 Tax=Collybia nuda TaxID=64659 RepID=A0A9P5YDM5_9AGAR|nr:hypothetical protein BDZ94DRAFT_1185769 [Collybia nuda]